MEILSEWWYFSFLNNKKKFKKQIALGVIFKHNIIKKLEGTSVVLCIYSCFLTIKKIRIIRF